ncbi:G0/G1 switch protein 2 [Rhinatrema bivittatum]|uniref:G0/G1 switch protein 2 n=1 Tax=Rhinatrema bivittatum TaxID=194408 RepID=UPI00112E1382|nr:G0/G1 switch protein 2 [Rhinatrema bivittatum]
MRAEPASCAQAFSCSVVKGASLCRTDRLSRMETMHELIPFAKEMLSQKPNRKMVKMYLLGSVLAFFGVVIGLVESVCSPFSSQEEEEDQSPSPEQEHPLQQQEMLSLVKSKGQALGARSLATRGHAS